mmetsp:Transcript_1991/g.2900  ORF Transcript_1991/g.2900 Transcript_1991/m.2900 type:complete len:565 (-) Transcript_1991:138-1832(-)
MIPVSVVNGLVYLSLFPLLRFKPEFVFKFILLGADYEKYGGIEAVMKSMSGVFLALMAVISIPYIYAGIFDHKIYVDISIMQRMTVVFLSVLISAFVIYQDPFEHNNFLYTMFFVADVFPALISGEVSPGGFAAIKKNINDMFRSTASNKDLRLETYLGMVFGFISCIYASVASDVNLALVVTMITTILPYFFMWFAAHTPSVSKNFLLFYRLAINYVLLYLVFGMDFYGGLNVVLLLQATSLIIGAFSSKTAAAFLGLSSLYVYKIECDYVLTTENGPFFWLVGWGITTSLLSYGWLALFFKGYDELQQNRIKGTHWQDNILGLFNIVVGGGLNRAGYLSTGLGVNVIYLLPPVTLWFSLETKLLTHLWVGTPFHPSWWMYGSTKPGQVSRYADNDWLNVTFSIGTILITVVLTSYAWVAMNVAVGFDAYRFESENTWKFAVAHGIFFIFHSGLWMIVASSGVPFVGKGPAFQKFPPAISALSQCDPVNCVALHKKDLVIGHILLFAGAFYLGDGSDGGPQGLVTKGMTLVVWIFTIVSKVKLHYNGFEVPYFKEQEEKKKAN